MRMFLITIAFALSSCAHPSTRDPMCADQPPQIGKDEALKDYTLRLISLYKRCVPGTPTTNK